MDAREQLRQYLEQRREAGERDLVLDGMSVEEAMRLLGAERGAKPELAGHRARADAARPPRAAATTGDWRDVLRGTGAGPDAPTAVPVSREPAPPMPATPSGAPDIPRASSFRLSSD